MVIHRQRNRSHIHHMELPFNNFHIADFSYEFSILFNKWIGIVEAVNLCGLQKNLSVYLLRPKYRSSISCKVGIACTGGKYHHPSFFQMSNSLSNNKGLSHFMHGNSGLNTGHHPSFFQSILQSQAVNYRGQHTHSVGRNPIHTI